MKTVKVEALQKCLRKLKREELRERKLAQSCYDKVKMIGGPCTDTLRSADKTNGMSIAYRIAISAIEKLIKATPSRKTADRLYPVQSHHVTKGEWKRG